MRRIAALIGAVVLVIFGSLALSAPANAYPPAPPVLSIQSGATTATGITVTVTNAKAGSVVTITFNRIAAAGLFSLSRTAASGSTTATASATGSATATLAATEAGTYSVVATGTDQAGDTFTVNATTTVALAASASPTPTAPSGGLADTGSDNATLLVSVGLGALVLGGTALFAARARRWGTES